MDTGSFRDRTVSGIAWSLFSNVGRQVATLVIEIVLARLLLPEHFGLVGMVAVLTNFAAVFAEFGFGGAIIHKQDLREDHLSSVFWLNVGGGLLLTGLFMAGAPLVAAFYDEPILVPITIVMAVNFLLRAVTTVHVNLMAKALDFRVLSIIEVGTVVAAGAVGIGMALAGSGVWSLVVRYVGIASLTAACLWIASDWRPRLLFEWGAVKELLDFSMHLLGTQTLNYTTRNVDDLLVGRVLGSQPLGIYQMAYRIMLFPLYNISWGVARVLFPSFSEIQEEPDRVRRIYLKITRIVALVTFPLMFGLFVTVEPFVLGVFGARWAAMIPVLRVLSLLGALQSIVTFNGQLYLSQGRSDVQFRVGLFTKANSILWIVIGLQWGIVGVAAGYAFASLLNSYPNLHYAGRLIGMSYMDQVRNLSGVFAAAAGMALAVWGIGMLLPPTWPPLGRLAVQVAAGSAAYLLLVHLAGVRAYAELKNMAAELLAERERSSPPPG